MNTKENFMKTKETSYKNVLKSNVVLFLTYGILTGVIFILITIIVKCTLHNIHNTDKKTVST